MSDFITNDDLALINPDLLPPQIRELVRLIGLPETIKLLTELGGIPTRIPFGNREHKYKLYKIVSRESVKKLIGKYGGQILDLPKADKILFQLRNIYIANTGNTKSRRQQAREHGLSYRMIKNIHKQSREEDPNDDLFGLDFHDDHRQAK